MVVLDLHLENFRNWRTGDFAFSPANNLLCGGNGTGKTSVLEALYATAFGKSFRCAQKRDMICWQSPGWSTRIHVSGPNGSHEIASADAGRFQRTLNDKPVLMAELVPHFFPVFFSTLSSVLVLDTAAALRGFFDRLVVGLTPLYLTSLMRYNAAIRQKNFLLKHSARKEELTSWNRILADMGFALMTARTRFVCQLNGALDGRGGRGLAVTYRPDVAAASPGQLFAELEALSKAESEQRMCLRGPHRDRFFPQQEQLPVTVFSSGEKRRALLDLVVCYVELYAELHGQSPVLLLDDYDAALDEAALDGLFARLPRVQVMATSVHPSDRFDYRIELPKEN